jgi:N-acetylglucosaminyldiphosphoundecaprenol N-acetyl-beta-D-mannosaminyltransferase
MDIPHYEVLGAKINAIRLDDIVPIFADWIERRERGYVILTGVHGVIEMQDDPALLDINNRSALTTPDGMPIVWLGWRRGFRHVEKVYAPDIMERAYAAGVGRGWRHYLYGGDEGVAEALAEHIRTTHPGAQVAGTYTPPFRPLTPEEKADVVARIDGSRADIVWVGLGCPKQDRWMAEFRPLLEAPILVGVGAGFDFLAGRKPLAPRWFQRSGFEWLFRLASEPRRLWPRYSRVVPRFIGKVLADEVRRLTARR